MEYGVLKKLRLITVLLCCSFIAAAQGDSTSISKSLNSKPVFHAVLNAGLVTGASDHDLHLQFINGLQYKTWFAGVGAGLDYYYLRSVPLFFHGRKTFSDPYIPFLYGNVGWNMPWLKKEQKQENVWYTSDFKTKGYFELGAGWFFTLNRRNAILVSAGYSNKRMYEMQRSLMQPPGTNDELYTTRIEYTLRRMMITIGFQL
jgi:hypothetical protein